MYCFASAFSTNGSHARSHTQSLIHMGQLAQVSTKPIQLKQYRRQLTREFIYATESRTNYIRFLNRSKLSIVNVSVKRSQLIKNQKLNRFDRSNNIEKKTNKDR